MRDAGVDIESHTVSHGSLNAKKGKTDEQYLAWLKSEIVGSKETLKKNLGIQVKAFAYPYGLRATRWLLLLAAGGSRMEPIRC
jgi:peptidoglycan/xylan/chitin deacetylase (PgdA/CDA1 family)